ncbi:hypothetical protein J6590_014072 [Homalodisca vitripennis]|nr:hypothetical protein J6590_014072 [Homalodisca vitripennis]
MSNTGVSAAVGFPRGVYNNGWYKKMKYEGTQYKLIKTSALLGPDRCPVFLLAGETLHISGVTPPLLATPPPRRVLPYRGRRINGIDRGRLIRPIDPDAMAGHGSTTASR